ncbi:MAG: type II secretion system F family protein [Thermaerobacter sp.]|nr:type II secretion system F family protein [Thermaerobacter sp.]
MGLLLLRDLFYLLAFVFIVTASYNFFRALEQRRAFKSRIWHLRRNMEVSEVKKEEMDTSFVVRVLRPWMTRWAESLYRSSPEGTKERVGTRLIQAGRPMTTDEFMVLKISALVVLGLLGTFMALALKEPGLLSILLIAAFLLLGVRLPELWLSRAIANRIKRLHRDLPDVLDLLAVSVQAGLGFDGAMQKITEKFHGPVQEEFTQFLKENRVGKPRSEALRDMVLRTGSDDMKSFVATVIQADELGVPLSKVLLIQAEHLRIKRFQRAQEQAMKAPIKMLFPLVFFIFPSMFVVILGPAVVQFAQGFHL